MGITTNHKLLAISVSVLFVVICARAESTNADKTAAPSNDQGNLLPGGGAEDPETVAKWLGKVRRVEDDAHSGSACMEIDTVTSVNVPGQVEIDPTKTYELSGFFKSMRPDQRSRILLDIRYLTADGTPIKPWMINPVSGVSELMKDVNVGDATIHVAKTDWNPKRKTMLSLAFNAQEDQSDLPNFDAVGVKNMKETDNAYVFELVKPVKQSYPAGTKVRLHRYLDYPRVWNNSVPTEWTRYAVAIAAKPLPGDRKQNYIWPGAKFVKVKLIHHYTGYPKPLPKGEKPPVIRIDDIVFKEIDPSVYKVK